ncbi:hypothetical protein GQ600_14374 [Phytophthora cactorum]|nr:hypothetical protein GQ600_14374 [Phytophthora cactorum]
MIETMHWLGKTTRCFFKRVLFNHDTVLVGEIMCAPQCNSKDDFVVIEALSGSKVVPCDERLRVGIITVSVECLGERLVSQEITNKYQVRRLP